MKSQNRNHSRSGFLAIALSIVALGLFFMPIDTYATRCVRADFDTQEQYQNCLENQSNNSQVSAENRTTSNTLTIGGGESTEASNTPFMKRVTAYIQWLFAGVGVLAVFGFILSAVQYSAAQDNPQSIAAAKSRMVNIVYGVLIFVFMFGLLQWLIPGGLF